MARRGTARKEGTGRTILLVDDSRDILDSMRALLEREGHTVLVADCGKDALSILRRQDVELLLVDYFMPGMTGEEVVRELRTFNSRTQVVLQTGYASERPPREMLAQLDIQGYCDKSEGPEELLLWTDVGLKISRQVRTLDMDRQGLRYILDATPDLHRIQPLKELLAGVLEQVCGLLGALQSLSGIEAKRASPGPDALLAMVEEERELAIHAGTGRFEEVRALDEALASDAMKLIQESLRDGKIHASDGSASIPLRIGALAVGVIFLESVPELLPENVEMLNVFANQAAVAVQNAQLYQMATLDPLSGVYSRKFWEQMALRELRTAFRFRHPLTIAIFDLDHFKSINDLHGHLTGDKALEAVGRILRGSSRASDVVGRFGGDEFVAILPRTSQEGATVYCNRVLRELERQALHGTMGPIELRTSIGLSTLLPHAFESDSLPRPIPGNYFQQVLRSLFSRADRQTYASKRTGGHCFHFDDACDWPDPRDWSTAGSSSEIASTFLPAEEK